MKVWIVGSQGLVGSTLHQLCREKKIACVATSKQEADVSDLEALRRKAAEIEPTHIVNCAAYTDVDGAENNFDAAYLVNTFGAENLGLLAKEFHCKLVHLSTDYVFDGEKREPYLEQDECRPLGVYAKSKHEGELRLLEVCPKACVIRSSWLFGVKGKNFISSMLSIMQKTEVVKVVADQKGRPTYCRDLAEAVLDLLCHSGIFHFANDGELSRFEMAQDIYTEARALGIEMVCRSIVPVPSSEFPTRAKRPIYSVLHTGKVERVLGVRPRTWNETLKEYLLNGR
jgi:dTDP-4-dehydrorhamnose reductase